MVRVFFKGYFEIFDFGIFDRGPFYHRQLPAASDKGGQRNDGNDCICINDDASGRCDQRRDPAGMGNRKVPLRTRIVLVLPASVCSIRTARRLQPHLAADRDLRIAVRRRIQKTVKYVEQLSGRGLAPAALLNIPEMFFHRTSSIIIKSLRLIKMTHKNIIGRI